MKKPTSLKYSLIAICALALTSACKNNDDSTPDFVSIPDAQFEQKLIDQGIDSDNTINQRISITDALAVTSLDLSNNDEATAIKDLSGIEGFSNLTSLIAINNSLKTIDISANTELTELNLHFNELTSVTGLNVASKLKTLNLSWNYLTEISIELPELEGLNIEENALTELHVSKSPNLTSLLAKANQLSTMDVSLNTQLSTLVLTDNQLEEIDLSSNTALEVLWISANQLQSLNISKQPELYHLSIINNPDLYCVTIAKDQTVATVNKTDTQMLFEGGCW